MSTTESADIVKSHVSKSDATYVREYISDHGELMTDVERTTIQGRELTVSSELTDTERDRVANAIRSVDPIVGQCYANALRVWEHDSAFNYVEGYAAADDLFDCGFEHAWNTPNGKLVDVTTLFDAYYGVVISDKSVLERYHDIGVNADVWSIIGNYHDKFDFLRKRGYL